MATRTRQEIGKRNQSRGAAFERLVAERVKFLKLENLIVKTIDRLRRRGVSLPDVEITQYPQFKIDCKYTEGKFSYAEKKRLILQTIDKYGHYHLDNSCICVFGEKNDRQKLEMKEVTVGFYTYPGIMLFMYLDEWLLWLDRQVIGGTRTEDSLGSYVSKQRQYERNFINGNFSTTTNDTTFSG